MVDWCSRLHGSAQRGTARGRQRNDCDVVSIVVVLVFAVAVSESLGQYSNDLLVIFRESVTCVACGNVSLNPNLRL